MRTHIHNFDTIIADFIGGWSKSLALPMVVLSFFGQPIICVGILASIAVFGWLKTNSKLIIASAICLSAILINSVIKMLLERERPATEYVKNMWLDTFSFPSGHACSSMVAYGLVAYLAWQVLPQPWGWIAVIVLSLFIALIGISRIYLGAHFASDVIGGWLCGAVALLIIIFIIKPSL